MSIGHKGDHLERLAREIKEERGRYVALGQHLKRRDEQDDRGIVGQVIGWGLVLAAIGWLMWTR